MRFFSLAAAITAGVCIAFVGSKMVNYSEAPVLETIDAEIICHRVISKKLAMHLGEPIWLCMLI